MGRDNMDGFAGNPVERDTLEPDDSRDAFAPGNYEVVQFATLARILDTLYALHAHFEPDKHLELLEAHAQGLLLGPSPEFTGQFLTDEINSEV